MARRLSAAHKKAISLALRRVKGATTGLDEYQPKPRKPKAPKKPTRASASGKKATAKKPTLRQKAAGVQAARKYDGSYDEGLHGPNAKKTAAKKTAGKKPAPAKAPAKKTAAKKAPAKKAPARKNVLPAPDNSPMPKKKTSATNRPTPKSESPAQARKADAEFKANREARRDSTPFGSIRNSMAEAQLINGRNSDRDRDEDLADAIQRDSKLTYAEREAKRNAGTVAQLNAAKRRKAELREKERAKAAESSNPLLAAREAAREKNRGKTDSPADRAEGISAALDDLVARPDMSAQRRSMAAADLANEAASLANEAPPREAAKARRLADRASELANRAVRPSTRAEQEEISRKYGSAETQQFTGTPGTWVGRDEAPNMARAGDTVHGTGQSKFFKGEMKIVGDPYVENDGYAYVEVSKRNGTIELARADMEGNILDDEGNVVAAPAKPTRRDSGTLIPNARELPKSNKPAPLRPGPVPKDRMENMARAGDKVKGNGTDNKFFKGTMTVVSDPYLEDDGNIYVEIARGNHSVEAVRTDADGNIFDDEDNLVAVRVTEGGTKIKKTSSRGKSAKKRIDAPDPRVSGFNPDGLW